MWWVGFCKRKKSAFFVPLFYPKEIFLTICVLSQCIVYWLHFQNIHTFTNQKTLLHIFFCSFFKSSKVFSVSLRMKNFNTMRVHWKSWFLGVGWGGVVFTKKQYIGGNCLKKGAWWKRGECFWGGVDTPMTLCTNILGVFGQN